MAHLRAIDCERLGLQVSQEKGYGMCNAAEVGEYIFAVLTLELMLRGEVGVQMSFLFSILFIVAQA